jgi:hypothetical protein
MIVKRLERNVRKKWKIDERSAKMKQRKMLTTGEKTEIKIGNQAIEKVVTETKTQPQEETGIGEKGNAIEREKEIVQGLFIENLYT